MRKRTAEEASSRSNCFNPHHGNVGGSLPQAWSVEGVARTLGQTSTAVRRNTLLATCAVAALAILELDQLERLGMPASSSPYESKIFKPLPAEPASNEQVPIVSSGPSSIAIEAAKPSQSVPPAVEGLPPGEDTR
jgi:hypothetical protein